VLIGERLLTHPTPVAATSSSDDGPQQLGNSGKGDHHRTTTRRRCSSRTERTRRPNSRYAMGSVRGEEPECHCPPLHVIVVEAHCVNTGLAWLHANVLVFATRNSTVWATPAAAVSGVDVAPGAMGDM
jgi:hypothetical protein